MSVNSANHFVFDKIEAYRTDAEIAKFIGNVTNQVIIANVMKAVDAHYPSTEAELVKYIEDAILEEGLKVKSGEIVTYANTQVIGQGAQAPADSIYGSTQLGANFKV